MSESRGQMTPVDFDTALAVLHGWVGERVELAVEAPTWRYPVASVAGVLRGAQDIAAPDRDDEFAFTLGAHGRFALRRAHFYGGDLFPYDGRLLVAVVDDPDEPDARVTSVLALTGPPLGRP